MEQKKTSSLLNELKSHPDKSLFDHLENVGNLSKESLESKKLNLDEFVDFETLKDISYLIGVTHDFGKATNYFQEYMTEKDEKVKRKLKNKPETHHAFLSSLFTYHVIKNYLCKRNLINKKYYNYLPIICFLVVKKHHGNLGDAYNETLCGDNAEDIVGKQIDLINFDELNILYEKICSGKIGVSDFRVCYKRIISEIKSGLKGQRKLIGKLNEENTLFYYFTTFLFYSILLDADKTDAANLKPIKRGDISADTVDNYKKLKFGEPENKIDQIREDIYREVISSVDELNLDNDKIMSLNVPTGTGKTLTSLSFALKLKERIKKEKGFNPRVIYSLPFMSIIDQNSEVFSDVLDNPTTNILLKHHHLSDIVYTRENEFEDIDTEEDTGKSLLLIEGWNSEIIVTTFMQFFYSIITNRNRAIRKFHNIANSIVILDEVQAIPHKYWLLLKEALKFFAEHFNTYFVFVTATQPLIFNEKENEIKSLIKNKDKYFKIFDRVDLIPKLNPLSIEDFKVELTENISQNPNKDFLIVMNTINSSKEIYEFIMDELKNKENSKIYYLSTNIIPKERLKLIKEIKKKTKKRKIIVSTQLIEAGVDIDVDVVYRDFAPLDSINQVAGRCNRNFGDDKGAVNLVILTEEENNKAYYKYIYGSFITDKTRKVFKDFEETAGVSKDYSITEPKFLELNNSYFEKVKEGMSTDKSNEILDHVKKLEFAELSKFELIGKTHQKVDIFVEVNGEAEKIWRKYQKIITNEKLKGFERKNEFLKIKKDFYDYVISVSKKDMGWLVPGEMNLIKNKELEDCYDNKTGFKYCEKSTIMC
ncbi:MAG: CRISPR-associated helicase/endonuclease Cas3 [Candidatus Altiarchaeales archaeon HGW-Altiarchaeales-3]|nr:MAG: CRISPR-associated helicase/endonuclease Cas3 [Candidatus Altiarchaeales archaeon HGW-Altiarchaeales-3]